jgi:hypothetical protein
MTERGLRRPEGTVSFLASGGAGKRAGLAAGPRAVYQAVLRAFRGVRIPAGDYTREVAFMYRLQQGRIAERWAVRDDLGMMQQLGAIIPNG